MTQFRQPKLQVLADGMALRGALAAQIITTSTSAGVFSASFALNADPDGLAAWDARATALIDIQIGLGSSGGVSLITGTIDRLAADPIRGVLHIEGRDLSSQLIEARTQEAFANQTASDIAILLAGRHGLTAEISPTTTPVGRYYSADHDRVTLARFSHASTEWDLLGRLALHEGFDVFVTGTSLFFQPAIPTPPPALILQAAADGAQPPNLATLRVERAMTLAGGLQVTVKSWNSQQQTAISQAAERTGQGAMRSYIYMRPNLAADDALALAQQKLATLTGHELVLSASMPGELLLAPRLGVALAGTNSVFDQTYVIDEVVRSFDLRRGFTQSLRGHTANQASA